MVVEGTRPNDALAKLFPGETGQQGSRASLINPSNHHLNPDSAKT